MSGPVTARLPASGEQHRIRSGAYEACVASVGATLRSAAHDGRDLIVPFDEDELRPAMRGALLAPWPNRTANGRYTFEGRRHQLPIDEPDRGNAVHGLVAWQQFTLVSSAPDCVVLGTVLEPRPAYPWRIRLESEVRVDDDGVHQEVVATNLSDTRAPFGMGTHPYVLAGRQGPFAIEEWTLQLPAERVLITSAARLIPVGEGHVAAVENGSTDFRRPRRIRQTVLNHAFTGLLRDSSGLARVLLLGPDGTGVEVSWDERCPWVQVYSADEPADGTQRHGLAVEPMTCPPDALGSGRDLVVLEPGSRTSMGWSVRRVTGPREPSEP